MYYNGIVSDFIRVVTPPGALNSFSLPTLCSVESALWHMISAAAFLIIGLAKFQELIFFRLDWIYHSIGIMMV